MRHNDVLSREFSTVIWDVIVWTGYQYSDVGHNSIVWNYTMVIKDSIVYYIINHGNMGHNNAIRTICDIQLNALFGW